MVGRDRLGQRDVIRAGWRLTAGQLLSHRFPHSAATYGKNMYQSRHFEDGRRWSGTRFRLYNVQQPNAGVRCRQAQIDQARGQATAGTGTRPMMPEAGSEVVAHRVKVLHLTFRGLGEEVADTDSPRTLRGVMERTGGLEGVAGQEAVEEILSHLRGGPRGIGPRGVAGT